jgi:hypothetical protein
LGAIVGAGFFLAQVFLRKQAPPRRDTPTRTVAPPKLSNAGPEAGHTAAPLNNNGATLETAAPAKVEAPEPPGEPGAEAVAVADELPDWVDPDNGACPPTHPIKVKLSSKIFHAPGGLAYDRTTPDRCYRDAATAEADGFRPSKR